MNLLCRFLKWRHDRLWERHVKRLRKMRVVGCSPNPRCIVYRRWKVPE